MSDLVAFPKDYDNSLPWHEDERHNEIQTADGGVVVDFTRSDFKPPYSRSHRRFIVTACNERASLVAELARVTEERDELREAIKAVHTAAKDKLDQDMAFDIPMGKMKGGELIAAGIACEYCGTLQFIEQHLAALATPDEPIVITRISHPESGYRPGGDES